MSRDLHTVSMMSGSPLAYDDRLLFGHLPDQVSPAGQGAVTAIAAGTPGAGYGSIPTVALTPPAAGAGHTGTGATATAVMGVVVAPTITAGGTGGTPGAVTLTGTDGTGTKFQATGVISGGGVLTSITAITVAGAYTALPGTLTAGAVSGGSLSGCTLNLSGSFGVISYTVGAGGTLYPFAGTIAVLTGGTPSTPAVPGAVTVVTAAGAPSAFDVAMLLPAKFSVEAMPSQDATCWITNKTQTGFTVNLAPRLAASSLAAGTVDIMIAA